MADEEKELTDELETTRNELEKSKREKEILAEELESKEAVIAGLEQTVASKNSEITILEQAITESNQKLAAINETLTQALASYKSLIVETSPEIPSELITGDTIEAINESLENARSLVDRVKKGIEEEISRIKVPAGAPQRAPLDLSVLSPREKIQYAIGGKK